MEPCIKCILFQVDNGKVEFNKDYKCLSFFDKNGSFKFAYFPPLVRLPSGTSFTSDLQWDPATSYLSPSLFDPSFPLVIAFPISGKLPEVKSSFSLAGFFPSLRFGAKGEVEDAESSSDSSSDEEEENGKHVCH